MDLKPITPSFCVSPQITPADVALAAARGFRTLVNNRPDGEAPDQPRASEIEAAARAHGLGYAFVPVVGANIGEADIDAFRAALDAHDGPVLAFCRSGTRSTMLWALAEARRGDADAVLRAAAHAGYDLAVIAPRVHAAAAAGAATHPMG
jgi:sulfide:quinone oxidoreductase